MDIFGYIAAFIMGGVLGSIGGGGSILTVPILVYLMGVQPVVATGYSLLIVGSAAAFGALRYYRKKQVNLAAAITFAPVSLVAVYLTRVYLVTAIPDIILTEPILLTKDRFIMILFAALMIISSVMLLNKSHAPQQEVDDYKPHYVLVFMTAIGVGIMTGILGAGGGFLIIPALILMMKIPMKKAVGTSLMIIAINSSAGFIGDMIKGQTLAFPMLLYFLIATLAGMFIATRFSERFSGTHLQKVFAVFTLVIAVIISVKEFN